VARAIAIASILATNPADTAQTEKFIYTLF
jgi:hypothetical protein